MQDKRLDDRVAQLIDSGITNNHRSMCMLLGLNAHKQVPVLFRIYQQKCMHVPKVCWCYSERPDFKKQKETIDNTLSDGNQSQFFNQNQITFSNYRDTSRLLGQTFSVLVLQDFDYITPNILAQTVETVKGGGLVIFLLNKLNSLEELRNSKMNIHKRYVSNCQIQNDQKIISRFTERFHKLLPNNSRLLMLDEQLNVIQLPNQQFNCEIIKKKEKYDFSDNSQYSEVRNCLLKLAYTEDQCTCLDKVMQLFMNSEIQQENKEENSQISNENLEENENSNKDEKENSTKDEIKEQKLNKEELLEQRKLKMLKKRNAKLYNQLMNNQITVEKQNVLQQYCFPADKQVFIKANRGRGKSALLGLAIAAAISQKATNILIFAPHASNIQTVFQFVEIGLKSLNYQPFNDFMIIKDGTRELSEIVGIDIFKNFKQIIRYISTSDYKTTNIQQSNILNIIELADLIVIDEAAAMPLGVITQILNSNKFKLLNSTVHGYEGSGRSLQVKVLNQLQKSQKQGKQLLELVLETPIRYSENDALEKWLYELLLLDCEKYLQEQKQAFVLKAPLPQNCQLFMISRDCLFSGEKSTESFLKLIWSIFATSHYKNQPNDLMLLSDNPRHRLFALFDTITDTTRLPMPLAVIHVSLEGALDSNKVEKKLFQNQRDDGDLVPWLLSQQFLDPSFAAFQCARTVRIAANPYFIENGYGSKALFDLEQFYNCKLDCKQQMNRLDRDMSGFDALQKKLPPLLLRLDQLKPEKVDYLAVSYGLSFGLHKFWARAGYKLVYLRQNVSEETNEHSCVMVLCQNSVQSNLEQFGCDFRQRFYYQLDCQFQQISSLLALKVLTQQQGDGNIQIKLTDLQIRRLESYTKRILDFNAVSDIIKPLCQYVFFQCSEHQLKQFTEVQKQILVGVGVQKRSFQDIAREMKVEIDQVQAIFSKAVAAALQEMRCAKMEDAM